MLMGIPNSNVMWSLDHDEGNSQENSNLRCYVELGMKWSFTWDSNANRWHSNKDSKVEGFAPNYS